VVQALASQTFRGGASLADERQAFTARLLALAQTHDLLLQGSWTEASIRTLVDGAARLHGQGYASRFRIDGDDVALGPKAALSFALVLHELGTNAVKYGALSTPEGHVALSWRQRRIGGTPQFHFRWEETGGPTVAPPDRRGFGTRLIERSLVQSLGARVEFAFPPAGVTLTMEAPLANLQRL
jgi:two-component sensor histidine kinase